MTNGILVDSCVLLDVVSKDPVWFAWSSTTLKQWVSANYTLVVNPIIAAEIAPAFQFDWLAMEQFFNLPYFYLDELPFKASVTAAKAHLHYRKQGGNRQTPMPDFYIGAHADASGYAILTRDVDRFKSYFPQVKLITP